MGRISHVADYVVIKETDRPFELPKPGWEPPLFQPEELTESFSFTLPDGAVLNERAIIAFLADPSSDADLHFEIEINERSVWSGHLRGGVSRGLWKIVGGGVLRAGDANGVEFRLSDVRRGSVRFSNVVVWFQRKVAEAPAEG